MQTSRRILSIFTLTMITVGSVDSIRNLPSAALFGTSLVFFYLIAGVFFLIPTGLVSAELASSWPERGGVYLWVKEAFGIPAGYTAIWLQWVENVIYYPALLSFIAGTIAYVLMPNLANDKYFLVGVILVIFWSVSIINQFGMQSSAFIANFCSITGLILPMSLIIILGITWIFLGHPLQIHFNPGSFLPEWSHNTLWASLSSIALSYCGIELATVHAKEAVNPQKAFPRALFYSCIIIFSTLVLGSLAIAIVLPKDTISLVAGIMQAFTAFLQAYHLAWLTPILGILLVLGGIGTVNNWIIAPTRGLLVAAQDGNLPPILQKENRFGAPSSLLIAQAIIVTLLSMIFLFLPSINESYWLLNALAAQLYMVMYIIMFITGIRLRFKYPQRERPFKIPGGKLGIILIGTMGILACMIVIFVSFIPPESLHVKSLFHYELFLISGLIVMILPPIISYYFRRPSWANNSLE